jgi:hypothetical protein
MADLTIRVPNDHVDAVRAALLHAYGAVADAVHHEVARHVVGGDAAGALQGLRRELVDLEDALEQLGWTVGDATGPVELRAHPEVLSDALHGALRDAIEAFAGACEAYWRGPGDSARPALERLVARYELFEAVQRD